MPSVVRQRPGGAPTPNGKPTARGPTGKPGSVLSKGIPVGQLRDSWIKMLLYGGNGIGKTTLSCQFEKPLLLLAFERCPSGGARSVRKMDGVTWLRPGLPDGADPDDPKVVVQAADVLADTERLAEELKADNPFKTIVFDHVTVFQDWVLEVLLGKPMPAQLNFGTVSGDQYRDRAERTKTLLRPWADLPCHTIFIGKEKDHNPPKDEKIGKTGKVQPDMRPRFLRGMQAESFVSVDLGGGTTGWLQDICEFACRLYMDREMKVIEHKSVIQGKESISREVIETGKFVRALRLAYHPNYFSRFRSDTPKDLPEAIEEPTYSKVLAAIQGRKVE